MEISLIPELITDFASFPITNSVLVSMIVSVIIIIITIFVNRKAKKNAKVPRGFQNIFEYILEALLSLVDGVTGDRKQTKKFFPLVSSIFIFVIISNWIGLIPAIIPGGTLGIFQNHQGEEVLIPFIRSNSADLNTTIALALIVVVTVQFVGITALGFRKYGGKFLVSPLKKPYFIGTFVGILEIISEFAKIISFSFRLFGNIFAGEVLLIVMFMLVPYILPIPFLLLEVFVGFIQALVFAMLTLVFMKMAAEAH